MRAERALHAGGPEKKGQDYHQEKTKKKKNDGGKKG